MMKWLDDLIQQCDEYIKSNPTLSAIIIGIVANILTSLVKQTWATTLTASRFLSRYASNKLLEHGIKGYELQLSEIETYREDKAKVLAKYISYLYEYFLYCLFFVVGRQVIINFFDNPNAIYGFYGAGANVMFRVFFGTYVHLGTLDKLVNRIDKYEENTKSILSRLKNQKTRSLIQSQ